jgi:uncharacterized protein (DUF2267 family)
MTAVAEPVLVSRVREDAGLRSAAESRRALGAVLGAVRCALHEKDACELARALPVRFASILEHAPTATVRNAQSFYAETERRERAGRGFAMEHAQAVLAVLAAELEPSVVSWLRRVLPPEVARLVRARRASAQPPPHVHVHPGHEARPLQTLSRARPGTAEPIAEATHVLAHAGSVARSSGAHAERMVETARSTRPGREDETLAASRGDERRR